MKTNRRSVTMPNRRTANRRHAVRIKVYAIVTGSLLLITSAEAPENVKAFVSKLTSVLCTPPLKAKHKDI